MSIQSFSVGQVLTAAQVNALQANDYNQTVSNKTASYTLVAADKGTRIAMSSTSATTITVNTSLFSAGDTLFIQNLNTGVSTITAGTATVTTSSSLALAQWEGGTLYFTSASAAIFFKSDGAAAAGGGQTLLNSGSTALSGSSVTWSNLSVDYKHLYLVGQNITISSGGGISLRLNGDSGSNYTRNLVREVNGTANADRGTGLTEIPLGVATNSTGYSNAGRFQINFPLYSGSNTKTLYSNTRCTNAGDSFTDFNIADWNNTAAVTSITILPSTGTFSTGNVYIYGVN